MRTEPKIHINAAQVHMPEGFPVIDPEEPVGQAALAGMELAAHGSMHLAASNRALWRRVAELEQGIREHWRENTHGLTANMRHADSKLHALIGL